MDSSILILVTGAAGHLGRHVADHLHAEGVAVRATDVVDRTDAPYEFRQVDLLDHTDVHSLFDGVGAVVHLGNHPGLGHPQRTFNENVSMNMNVFQAAAEQSVHRIVFASTLQLIGSHVDCRTVCHPPAPPHYPMSAETPAQPANAYALSKSVSEVMLRYFSERCDVAAVAVRFPWVRRSPRHSAGRSRRLNPDIIREGFSCISQADAARLVLAILRADLPGFRIYTPGLSDACYDVPLQSLIREHHPGLPDSLETLIDCSRITCETGWEPTTS